MKRFIVKILVATGVIIVLPLLFLFIRQFSKLNENEEIVQRAFDQQIETILFTVNQNSENYLSSWVNKIDIPIEYSGDIMHSIITPIIETNMAVQQISFYNVTSEKYDATYYRDHKHKMNIPTPNVSLVTKLTNFYENDYQRLEAVQNNNFTDLYFVLKSSGGNELGHITINTKTFIEQNLSPGIQQISQNRFMINITDTVNSRDILNDSINHTASNIHTQKMWYLPGYVISIGLQNKTIEELVSQRAKRDNYIFLGLMIIVLLGIGFVIYAVRKEIHVAELKSEFVSNVSHEIRTPLALISMYSETLLLKRVKTEEKTSEYLSIINYETNRLTDMVNRILTFSRIEKNKKTYSFEAIDLNEVIIDVEKNYRPHFEKEKVTCNLNLTSKSCVVYADEGAVFESLINLVENAIKYNSNNEKKIDITTQHDGEYIQINIVDNGIGMSSKNIHHIFDKFYRITQGDLANKVKGTGIGLSIVKEIMEKHKGKITVKSRLNIGSTFSLFFSKNRMLK